MKPRIRNANLLITHVLDRCVKLLAVLHISSAQGQSVDLSVEIATGRRRMIDIISTPGKEDKDTLLAAHSSDHHATKHSR